MDQNSDLDHFQVPSCSLFRMPWSRMPKYSSMDNCLTDRNNSKRVTVIQDLSQFKFLIKMKFLPARHLCYFWPKFLRMEYWANLHTLWRWCNQQPSLLSEKINKKYSKRGLNIISNRIFLGTSLKFLPYHICCQQGVCWPIRMHICRFLAAIVLHYWMNPDL